MKRKRKKRRKYNKNELTIIHDYLFGIFLSPLFSRQFLTIRDHNKTDVNIKEDKRSSFFLTINS